MISERTLKKWRRDALQPTVVTDLSKPLVDILSSTTIEMKERILRLTQELMDLRLIQKGA
jgi:hypothetical protein